MAEQGSKVEPADLVSILGAPQKAECPSHPALSILRISWRLAGPDSSCMCLSQTPTPFNSTQKFPCIDLQIIMLMGYHPDPWGLRIPCKPRIVFKSCHSSSEGEVNGGEGQSVGIWVSPVHGGQFGESGSQSLGHACVMRPWSQVCCPKIYKFEQGLGHLRHHGFDQPDGSPYRLRARALEFWDLGGTLFLDAPTLCCKACKVCSTSWDT